jgi:hypothetical protein
LKILGVLLEALLQDARTMILIAKTPWPALRFSVKARLKFLSVSKTRRAMPGTLMASVKVSRYSRLQKQPEAMKLLMGLMS